MALITYPKVNNEHLALTGFSVSPEHFNDYSESPVGVLKVNPFSTNPAGRMRGLLQWFGYGVDAISQSHLIALQRFLDNMYDTAFVNHTIVPINEMVYKSENGNMLFLPTPTASQFADTTVKSQARDGSTGETITTLAANRTAEAGQYLNMTIDSVDKVVQITRRVAADAYVLRPYHRVPAGTAIKRALALTVRPDLSVARPNVVFSNSSSNAAITMQFVEHVP